VGVAGPLLDPPPGRRAVPITIAAAALVFAVLEVTVALRCSG
jgi:hypothetical protein